LTQDKLAAVAVVSQSKPVGHVAGRDRLADRVTRRPRIDSADHDVELLGARPLGEPKTTPTVQAVMVILIATSR
jgi:hypothetical protein